VCENWQGRGQGVGSTWLSETEKERTEKKENMKGEQCKWREQDWGGEVLDE